jgi:hypothetical protein
LDYTIFISYQEFAQRHKTWIQWLEKNIKIDTKQSRQGYLARQEAKFLWKTQEENLNLIPDHAIRIPR